MALTQVSTGGVKDGTILNADINASAAIAGTKISPSFTSDIILTNANPSISLIDSDANSDFKINVNGGIFSIKDQTNVDATRLAINSSGNVGIGTTNPAVKFVVSNGGAEGLEISHSSGTVDLNAYNRSTSARSPVGIVGQTFTVATGNPSLNTGLFQNSSGLVGIGTTNPTSLLTLNHATSPFIRLNDSDTTKCAIGADGGLTFVSAQDNNPLVFTTSTGTAFTERMRIAPDGAVRISGSISNAAMTHITDGGSATTLGTAATCRISNNGGNSAFSVFEAESNVGSIRLANDGQFYVTGASTFNGDIRVDRGTAGVDGIVGQAYSGYFGLKHADQTINTEYMILNNNTSTFISCTAGYSIYIRPSANSQVHETIFAHGTTTFNTNILMNGHALARNQHQWGHLEGSYDNVGNNATKSNPIYTIGSSYNPNENDLNTASNGMFGIGFSHGSASFLPTSANWGLYAAANGIAKVLLDAGNGRLYFSSNVSSTPRFISEVTGDYGSMQISNGPKNGWSGFSIDGHSVFMSNGSSTGDYFGLYDDNASQWALLYARQAWVRLYYGGGLKLETTNVGVTISGTISATNLKSFRISHPLSELSKTKDLVHAAIEGPQMDLMYRGKVDLVNGTATVNIDTKSGMTEGTFDVLNRDVQCFTTNETGWTNVKGSVAGNKLTIVAEDNSCTDTISWIVIGERKDNDVISSEVTDDNGDLIVEPDKQVIDDEPKMDS